MLTAETIFNGIDFLNLSHDLNNICVLKAFSLRLQGIIGQSFYCAEKIMFYSEVTESDEYW